MIKKKILKITKRKEALIHLLRRMEKRNKKREVMIKDPMEINKIVMKTMTLGKKMIIRKMKKRAMI